MSLGHTKIPYLTALWHPTTGCSRGCPGCWARDLVCNRLAGTMKGLPRGQHALSYDTAADAMAPFAPTFHADRLDDPLRSHKPQVIGVSFLGDLFDHGISSEQIAAVFGVMAAAPQHTFILLTKQAERLETLLRRADVRSFVADHLPSMTNKDYIDDQIRFGEWPLPNVWLGVSVTGPDDFRERMIALSGSPAAHRWVSVEPQVADLGSISEWLLGFGAPCLLCGATGVLRGKTCPDCCEGYVYGLDAVVCGGQSGPGAVPFNDDWARSLRDQCAAAGVPFYFKQRSGMHPDPEPELDGVRHTALPWRLP